MIKRPFVLRRNDNLKRSKSCRPRIEWMEPRTLLSPPTVTALNPTTGSEAGGTLVTITGTSFIGATSVDFGTTAATELTVVDNTAITADSPAGAGVVNVSVTTPAGTSAISPADRFTYTAAAVPTVTGISPTGGSTAGGTSVTITGTNFTDAALADFGTTAVGITVVNDTTITATSPAGTGTVNVTVTSTSGTSATSPADEFTYTAAVAPTVTAVSPTTGSTVGSTSVTITGTSFTGATAVDFGTTPATDVTVFNDTTITANSPAGTGTVNVTVTAPGGTSATSPADEFTYTAAAAPTVTGISPAGGPASGGSSIMITGTSFTGATAVDFGTTPATEVFVFNDTTITATIPAGTGTVNVTVTAPGGTSATSPADLFAYAAAAPTVTGVSPTSGSTAGGTTVTITGTGFTGATAGEFATPAATSVIVVDFGTTAATAVTVVNATTITAVSPAGTGTVNVTVITPGGTSAISAADQFTYVVAPPTVVSLVRFGFHMQQTSLVLTFSSALDATPAENVNNYQIVTMGGVVIPVSTAVYDPATFTVTLFPTQLLSLHTFYQLTVNGTTPSGLTGATGVPLDGLGNGTPGTNYVKMFSGAILVGPAPAMLSAEPKKLAAAKKELAADEKKWVAEPKKLGAEKKELAAAQKKLAAAQKRLAAQLRLVQGPSGSAIDALSALGKSTARPKAVRIHVGHHHPRG